MATFLILVAPIGGASRVLNVASFREEPLEWVGEEGPSFTGQLLSTQSNPRQSFTCTVEFTDPAKVDDFKSFISSGLDLNGRPVGFRKLLMASTQEGSIISGALRGTTPLEVTVRMGAMTPTDYVMPGAGPAVSRTTQSWQVDLAIREA